MSVRSLFYFGFCSLLVLSACSKTHKKSTIPMEIINGLGGSTGDADSDEAKYVASRSFYSNASYSGDFQQAAESEGLDFGGFCMQVVSLKTSTGINVGTALELSANPCPTNALVPYKSGEVTVLEMKPGSVGYDIIGSDPYENSYTVGNASISGGKYQVQDLCTNSYVSEGICTLAIDNNNYNGLIFRD